MSLDTFTLYAANYNNPDAALADFKAVEDLYTQLGIVDTYDAAVVAKKENGKVKIVKRHEQPTRHGAGAGLAVGLAAGAVVALFPAAALAVGAAAAAGAPAVGGLAGAGLGALAGHVARGMSRDDLKRAGELLDAGQSGLVVVAATDVQARVEKTLNKAEKVLKSNLAADLDEAMREIREQIKA